MNISWSAQAPLPVYAAEELTRLDLEELLDLLLCNEDRVPRALLDECARREEAMVERLATLIESDAFWRPDAAIGEWWLRLHAAMILGLIATERAGLLLVALMRRIEQAQDVSLQDWLSGYWPALFCNKSEITFVNYVLDQQSADLQIIVTGQQTGSGGNEYTLAFMGLRAHQGKDATLRYYSKPTDTEEQFRRGLVNTLKQGLIPYVYDTPLAEFISISFAQKKEYRPTPETDPWNYWVFSLGVRGNGEFETQAERYSYQFNVSANRTTEEIKFRLYGQVNFIHRRYEIPDEEPIISDSNRKNLSASVVGSSALKPATSPEARIESVRHSYVCSCQNAPPATEIMPAGSSHTSPETLASAKLCSSWVVFLASTPTYCAHSGDSVP